MAESQAPVPVEEIARTIHTVRGHRVMLDFDLARLHGTTTTPLNQQVRRNRTRFPADFMFQLTPEEITSVISQFATSKPPLDAGSLGIAGLAHQP